MWVSLYHLSYSCARLGSLQSLKAKNQYLAILSLQILAELFLAGIILVSRHFFKPVVNLRRRAKGREKMDRVKGKVAVVTGSASGIGEAAVKLLAREGARVAIVDIDDANGERVAEEIGAEGGVVGFWHMDVAIEDEVKKTFAAVYDRYQQLHILVNNAGIAGPRKPAHETPVEDWDRVLGVNLKGAFFCTEHAAPYILKTRPGSVVNVASVYGRFDPYRAHSRLSHLANTRV